MKQTSGGSLNGCLLLVLLVVIAGIASSIGGRPKADEPAAIPPEQRAADSARIVQALRAGTMAPEQARTFDATIHQQGLRIEHAVLHERIAAADLARADSLIDRHGDPQEVVSALASAGQPGVSDSLRRRRLALQSKNKPRLDAAAKKAAAEARAAGKAARIAYAKAYEDRLLDQGINATVTAAGADATRLTMKWVLVSKVTAHQYAKGDILAEMRTLGFTKFTITDGYDESWYWDLQK